MSITSLLDPAVGSDSSSIATLGLLQPEIMPIHIYYPLRATIHMSGDGSRPHD